MNKAVAWTSLIFLVVISLMAVFAPRVTRYSYDEQNISQRLEGPTRNHWMGTDPLGRDLYSRIIYGARVSIPVGVLTALFALVLGMLVGSIAGYRGGWTDLVLMRIVDLFYIFPSPLFAILLTLLFGRGLLGIILALGIAAWITQARLIRAQILKVRELSYVEAARALGATHPRILFRHIIPNILGPVIVSLTVQIPTNIMTESFLSFIGLGIQPPFSSWGTLAQEGYRAMEGYPYLIIFPGIILFFTMMAFHFLGESLSKTLR